MDSDCTRLARQLADYSAVADERDNRETLQNLLHHPIYAGFYRYG